MPLLGGFAKFQKWLQASTCLSVCPSVCVEKLSSHWTDFHEIYFFFFFENKSRKFNLHWNLTRIKGTLHKDQYTFTITSRSVFLRVKNVWDRSCTENENTHFMFGNSFFRKSCRLWDNVEKYCRVGQATYGNKTHAHCMLDTQGYKHTLRICNTYCFSTPQCYVILLKLPVLFKIICK